jgi:opacity protein-like surface antigen
MENLLRRPALAAVLLLALAGARLHAQAKYTASRAGDLQIGLTYSSANANYEYVHNRIAGIGGYADFDIRAHLGFEFTLHQLDDPNSAVYQRTYEFGVRAPLHLKFCEPYARASVGRGVLNFPKNDANLAYNMLAGAAGADFAVHPRVNVRAEFEYEYWLSTPGSGLHITPSALTVGVAYHFGPGTPH